MLNLVSVVNCMLKFLDVGNVIALNYTIAVVVIFYYCLLDCLLINWVQVQIKREQNRRAKARLAGNPAGQRRWASARVVPIADSRFPRRQDELGTEVPQPPVSATVSPIEMTSVVIHPTAATPEGTTAFCSPSSPPSAPTDPSTPLAPLSSSTEHIPAASAVKLFSTASNDSMPMASAVASELPVLAERCMYGGGVHPRL